MGEQELSFTKVLATCVKPVILKTNLAIIIHESQPTHWYQFIYLENLRCEIESCELFWEKSLSLTSQEEFLWYFFISSLLGNKKTKSPDPKSANNTGHSSFHSEISIKIIHLNNHRRNKNWNIGSLYLGYFNPTCGKSV